MTELNQIYKCEICGNIVEVLHTGVGQLVCCGKPMNLVIEKFNDEGQEKHAPVVEVLENSVKVKVGLIPHPMEEKHYIEWIEIFSNGKVYRQTLKPGDAPEAVFPVLAEKVKIYCNIHGLWST